MLDVIEVQQALFPLFFRVDLTVAQQRPRKETRRRIARIDILCNTLENIVEIHALEIFGTALERTAILLDHLPHICHRAFIEVCCCFEKLFAQRLEAKAVQTADHAVKIPRRRACRQLLCHAQISLRQLLQGIEAVQRRKFCRLVKLRLRTRDPRLCVLPKLLHDRAFCESLDAARRIQRFDLFVQPRGRLRHTLDRIKSAFDHLAKPILIAVAAVGVQEFVKFRIVRCKIRLDQLVHRLSSQDQLTTVIADLKIRLDIDEIKIPANDLQRERVEGTDIRVRQQIQLLFQKHKLALQRGTRVGGDIVLHTAWQSPRRQRLRLPPGRAVCPRTR